MEKDIFRELKYDNGKGYIEYLRKNNLDKLFNINLEDYGRIDKKIKKGIYEPVDPKIKTPKPPELDDLVRLHFLITSRKVTTILEFGVGKSTIVMADALKKNKEKYFDYVKNNLRRSNPFELHSVDNSRYWISYVKKSLPNELKEFVKFYYSPVYMSTFNGRVCTFYKKLPNICPDFIYLDGPDQFNVRRNINGISTRSMDRLPMAADILLFEHFLLPGTMILVDGRTANSRFLLSNLQRKWEYKHFPEEDIHIFELLEEPLGPYNKRQLEFCLGEEYFKRLKNYV